MVCATPEASVYPTDLLGDTRHRSSEFYVWDDIEAEPYRWWLIHTRPRQERCLAADLRRREIPFYLPLVSGRRRRGRRTEPWWQPLFSGYLAIYGDEPMRIATLETGRVVQALRVVEQQQFREDLERVHRLIASGAPVTREERLIPGDRVAVRSGPLVGLEGTVLHSATGRRLVVQVDFIQRGASVIANDFDLEYLG